MATGSDGGAVVGLAQRYGDAARKLFRHSWKYDGMLCYDLAAYQAAHDLTDQQMIALLEISPDDYPHLLVAPGPQEAGPFSSHTRKILQAALATGANSTALAAILNEVRPAAVVEVQVYAPATV